MLQQLLEPIVKYVETAAHLAAIQVTYPHDQQRIDHATQAANNALVELTIALMNADTELCMREVAGQTYIVKTIAEKITSALESTSGNDA